MNNKAKYIYSLLTQYLMTIGHEYRVLFSGKECHRTTFNVSANKFMISLPLLAIFSILFLNECISSPGPKIYIYGATNCPACVDFKKKISSLQANSSVVFYDISVNKTNLEAYHTIYEIILPYASTKLIPLTGVFIEDKLKFIIVGDYSIEYLRYIFRVYQNKSGVIIIYGNNIIEYNNSKQIVVLEKLFKDPSLVAKQYFKEQEKAEIPLFVILLCAFIDSINPCTFSIFTALLLIVFHAAGKRNMVFQGYPSYRLFILCICLLD